MRILLTYEINRGQYLKRSRIFFMGTFFYISNGKYEVKTNHLKYLLKSVRGDILYLDCLILQPTLYMNQFRCIDLILNPNLAFYQETE